MASSKQRQAAFRKRNAELGRYEMRGIMATKDEQAILKAKIKLMLEELMRQDRKDT
jgi:hypothetical protein